MEILMLPAKGTIVIINGGLLLLGIAFFVKYAIKQFIARKK